MSIPQESPEATARPERRQRPQATRVPERRAGGGEHYSRLVSTMKLLFPLLAGILLLLIGIWPQLQGGVGAFRFDKKLDTNDARDLRMVNTRYTGVDRQNRPFTITADVAREKPGVTESIALEGPKADLTTTNGVWIALTAENGLYKSGDQTLDLSGNVELFQDKGNEFRTGSVHMNLGTGAAEGRESIVGQGPFGRIEAQGFRVLDRGNTILFTGKTTLSLEPGGGRVKP